MTFFKLLAHKTTFAALVLSGFMVTCQSATAEEAGLEGRKVGETIFATMDPTGRGWIHQGDLEQFRALVFTGMDSDDDKKVPYAEFAAWDPGFAYVANDMKRGEAYTTASKIVFAFWDRNGDGEMTEAEMRLAMSADFRRADLDDDGTLSQQEFLQGFPIMLAMRAALRPDL